MSYATDRAWSDRFIPSIRKIVGPYLLAPSSFEVDTKQAADLIVLTGRDVTVAARVRRSGYADRYPYDFTIRSFRESGAVTELSKFIDGFGDWMFYGHEFPDGSDEFSRWFLVDLKVWRSTLLRAGFSQPNGWKHLGVQKSNGDGTHFVAFDVRNFPKALIASSHPIPNLQKVAA